MLVKQKSKNQLNFKNLIPDLFRMYFPSIHQRTDISPGWYRLHRSLRFYRGSGHNRLCLKTSILHMRVQYRASQCRWKMKMHYLQFIYHSIYHCMECTHRQNFSGFRFHGIFEKLAREILGRSLYNPFVYMFQENGWVFISTFLLAWQLSPDQPSKQSQVPDCVQVPPFWQGVVTHARIPKILIQFFTPDKKSSCKGSQFLLCLSKTFRRISSHVFVWSISFSLCLSFQIQYVFQGENNQLINKWTGSVITNKLEYSVGSGFMLLL